MFLMRYGEKKQACLREITEERVSHKKNAPPVGAFFLWETQVNSFK